MPTEKLELWITVKDQASGVMRGLSSTFSTVFKVGLGAAVAGLGAVTAGLAFSVKEAMEAQEVQAQLAAVLKSTGRETSGMGTLANQLAESLMKVTRFSDETILSGETMLLQFKNIGKDIFPQASETALDLATRLGMDVPSAAKLLGKALETPGEGLLRLKQAGVSFTDQETEMIQKMVDAGDVAGAQKFILDSLAKSVGGAARAAGDTFAGKLDILKNSLSNVAEGIGTALLPILTKFLNDVILPLVPKIQELATRFTEWITALASSDLVGWFQNMITTIQTFINTIIIPFVSTHAEEFKGALIGIGAVLAAGAIIGGIMAIGGAIAALMNPVTLIIAGAALLGAAWTGNWGGIQEKTQAVIEFLKPYIQSFISGIQTWWAQNGAQIIAAAKAIWDGIVAGFEFFKGIFMGIFSAFQSAVEGDWTAFGEKLRAVWDTLWAKIKEIVSAAITAIKNYFKNTDWKAVGKGIIDGIVAGIKAAADLLVQAAIAAAKAALDAVKGFLGINSPSVVFAGLGEQMMAGMAKGIQANIILPQNAVTSASAGTTTAMRGGGSSGGLYIANINIYALDITDPDDLVERVAQGITQAASSPSMMYAR